MEGLYCQGLNTYIAVPVVFNYGSSSSKYYFQSLEDNWHSIQLQYEQMHPQGAEEENYDRHIEGFMEEFDDDVAEDVAIEFADEEDGEEEEDFTIDSA